MLLYSLLLYKMIPTLNFKIFRIDEWTNHHVQMICNKKGYFPPWERIWVLGVPFSEEWDQSWTTFFGEISKYDDQMCMESFEGESTHGKQLDVCGEWIPKAVTEVLRAGEVRLGGRGRAGNTSEGISRLSASVWQSPLSYHSGGNVWGMVLVLLSVSF